MNEIKLFENPEFGQVRVLEQEGEPWFVGKDVANMLGYQNSRKALADHVDEEDKGVTKCDTLGGTQDVVIINESGLYSLILRSQLPEAKAFKRWITHEVIPSIRKTGGYIQGQEELSDDALMAKALEVAHKVLAERERQLAEKEKQVELMQPKADYFDALVDASNLTNFRDTAKELGVTQTELINFCEENGYIYHTLNGIRPKAQYVGGANMFVLKDYVNGQHTGTQTMITPKGKGTLRILLNARDGRLPI